MRPINVLTWKKTSIHAGFMPAEVEWAGKFLPLFSSVATDLQVRQGEKFPYRFPSMGKKSLIGGNDDYLGYKLSNEI